MKTARIALEEEFATDHRKLTRGFAALLEALKTAHDDEARQVADHIDLVGGPHIEFEETVLYPVVERVEGPTFASQLYSEHRTAFEAVAWLLKHTEKEPIDDIARARLVDQVQTGLDHAESCGSLMGHLTALDESQHETFLQKLYACREAGRRWSDYCTSHEPNGK
ncbi:MAG: hemerythrin domain-containing protein [Rhodopirellula sp.]|nr:hemerythrin domain-containing protein [Rhodopirellula sp.]